MSMGTAINDTTLAFLMLVFLIFFYRKKVNNYENKIYSGLLIDALIGNILAIPLFYIVKYYQCFTIATYIVPRVYLIYLVVWTGLLSWYLTQIVSKKDSDAFFNKNKRIYILYVLIFSFIIMLLPIEYFSQENVVYTYGLSVNITYVICGFNIAYWLYGVVKNFNKIRNRKCIPIIAVCALGLISAIIQKIDPSIRLMTFTISFITTIMYFTIENPDVKMVSELYKNKNIMEQTYEDKSNFLFEVTEEIRNPIINITNICKNVKESKTIKEYQEGLNEINDYVRHLEFIVNDVLDTSTIDVNKMHFINNKYNIEVIYNEIVAKVNNLLSKDIKFSSSISHNIPLLYGDSIKLKQIIQSLMLNSIKHTKSGFIELNIDTIERFDAVRLIITIKDSSKGLGIDKINEILSITGSIDPKEVEELNNNELKLSMCQKIVKLLGGNLLIRCNEEKGMELILTLDQKIADNTEKYEMNKYEKYIDYRKNIVVVTQNKERLAFLKRKFAKEDIKSIYLLNGYDLIDRIKSNNKYNYIVVDDEMSKINGYNLLKELQKEKNFNTPVIVMLEQNKECIKDSYLKEGFSDYILTNDIDSELERIINKY